MTPAHSPATRTKSEPEPREEPTVTHELVAGIFKESGRLYSYLPKLENTLPHLQAKPWTVGKLSFTFPHHSLLAPFVAGIQQRSFLSPETAGIGSSSYGSASLWKGLYYCTVCGFTMDQSNVILLLYPES